MTQPLANALVTFRGVRGGKTYLARNVAVKIYPAAYAAQTDPINAERFKYGMHWDPADAIFQDGSGGQHGPPGEGDILLWERFPNQDIALGPVFVADGGLGAFAVYTAYFLPVDIGQT